MTDASSPKVIAFPSDARRRLEERADEDLMLQAAHGSTEAFEVLVRRHHPGLARYCARFTGSAAEGDELAQEALVRVWEARASYQPRARFVAFLLTVTRNLCRTRARDSGRRERWHAEGPPEEHAEAASSEEAPVDGLLRRERHQRVREAVGGLPEKFREVLLLRFDQELDYAEIARIVGSNEATVRSRVFHGLKKLRGQMAGGAL